MRSSVSTPRDFHPSVFDFLVTPAPLQALQGCLVILPLPWHCGTGLLPRNPATPEPHPRPCRWGGFPGRALLGAGTVAHLAGFNWSGCEKLVVVPRCLFERDLEFVAQVRATERRICALAGVHGHRQNFAEDVAEGIAKVAASESAEAASAGCRLRIHAA